VIQSGQQIDSWRGVFAVANAVDFGEKVSIERLQEAQSFWQIAKDYKSPLSSKLVDTSTVNINMLNTAVDNKPEDPNAFTELMMMDPEELLNKRKAVEDLSPYKGSRKRFNTTSVEEIPTAVNAIHNDWEASNVRMYTIATKLYNKESLFSNEVKVLLLQIVSNEDIRGSRVINKPSIYQCPTIWGSI
jgi:hypothetical protein